MSIYEDANRAFERGELERVRELLSPGAASGDPDVQAALGSFLTLTSDPRPFLEGVEWLRRAADAGDGIAAHNLATILLEGGPGVEADCEEAMRYLQRARDSGFVATVASDLE
jgi:Sel1 repeat-containing protein